MRSIERKQSQRIFARDFPHSFDRLGHVQIMTNNYCVLHLQDWGNFDFYLKVIQLKASLFLACVR